MTAVKVRIDAAAHAASMKTARVGKALPMIAGGSSGESGECDLWHNARCYLDCSDLLSPVINGALRPSPEIS